MSWAAPVLRGEIRRAAGGRAAVPAAILPVPREIFATQATLVRLAALARLAGLGDDIIAGRRIAVLSGAADAATATACRPA